MGGRHGAGDLTRLAASVMGRGLHSFPIQLNLSSSVHCVTRLGS